MKEKNEYAILRPKYNELPEQWQQWYLYIKWKCQYIYSCIVLCSYLKCSVKNLHIIVYSGWALPKLSCPGELHAARCINATGDISLIFLNLTCVPLYNYRVMMVGKMYTFSFCLDILSKLSK